MKIEKAIKVLKIYNKWRRGADIPQPHPTEIGLAIDKILKELKTKL